MAPLALIVLWPHAPLAGIGVVVLSHALLLYPTLSPNAQWLGPVVTHFRTDRREVWLTIDDGPEEDTTAVLDILEAHGVEATFFVKGVLAQRHERAIEEILRRGHSIANHSHTHPSGSFWCLPPWRIAREIDECNEVIARLSGERPRWFRTPVGMKNPFVHPALDRRGMRLIGWSARGFDAVLSNVDDVVRRIVDRLTPGAIIVLHQGREHSSHAIARVIAAVKERGYAFRIPPDDELSTGHT